MSNGVGSGNFSTGSLGLTATPDNIDSANQSFAGHSVTALTEDRTPARQLPASADTTSLPESKTLSERSIFSQEPVETLLLKEIAALRQEVQELKAALAASGNSAAEESRSDSWTGPLSEGSDVSDSSRPEATFSGGTEVKHPDEVLAMEPKEHDDEDDFRRHTEAEPDKQSGSVDDIEDTMEEEATFEENPTTESECQSESEKIEIKVDSSEQPVETPVVKIQQTRHSVEAEKAAIISTAIIQPITSEPESTSLAAREISIAENVKPELTRPVPGMNKPSNISIHKRRASVLLTPINFLKRFLIGDSRKMHHKNDVLKLTANKTLKDNPGLLDGEVNPQTQCYNGLKSEECESFVLRGAKLKLIEQYKPQSDEARDFASKHKKLTEFLDKPFERYSAMWKSRLEVKVPFMDGDKLKYDTIDLSKIVASAERGEAAKKSALQDEVKRIKESYPLVVDYIKNNEAKETREALIQDLMVNKADYIKDIEQAQYNKLKSVLDNRANIKEIMTDYSELFDSDGDGKLPETKEEFLEAYSQLKAKFKAADQKLGDAKSAKRKLELEEAFTFRKASKHQIEKALDESAEKVREVEQEVVKLRKARDLVREILHQTRAYNDSASSMLDNL